MSNYVVTFRSGTSGRFIANIIWMLIHNLPTDLKFTDVNSAHDHNPWCGTWKYINGAHNKPDVYKIWEFVAPDNGLFISHTYPDFNVINERMPDLRSIIITYSKDDLLEIATNHIHKHIIPDYRDLVTHNDKEIFFQHVYEKEYNMYYLAYIKMYGKPMKPTPEFFNNREFIDTMIYLKYDTQLEKYYYHPFFEANTTVIDDNVLVIKFADIFKQENDSFVALNQLRRFLKTTISEETKQAVKSTYTKYVNNRTEFVKNNLPIETYEDYQNRKNTTLVPRYGWSPS
jgi:hypothetical protein